MRKTQLFSLISLVVLVAFAGVRMRAHFVTSTAAGLEDYFYALDADEKVAKDVFFQKNILPSSNLETALITPTQRFIALVPFYFSNLVHPITEGLSRSPPEYFQS